MGIFKEQGTPLLDWWRQMVGRPKISTQFWLIQIGLFSPSLLLYLRSISISVNFMTCIMRKAKSQLYCLCNVHFWLDIRKLCECRWTTASWIKINWISPGHCLPSPALSPILTMVKNKSEQGRAGCRWPKTKVQGHEVQLTQNNISIKMCHHIFLH